MPIKIAMYLEITSTTNFVINLFEIYVYITVYFHTRYILIRVNSTYKNDAIRK